MGILLGTQHKKTTSSKGVSWHRDSEDGYQDFSLDLKSLASVAMVLLRCRKRLSCGLRILLKFY